MIETGFTKTFQTFTILAPARKVVGASFFCPYLCTSIPQRASALDASESGCKEVMHRIRDSS